MLRSRSEENPKLEVTPADNPNPNSVLGQQSESRSRPFPLVPALVNQKLENLHHASSEPHYNMASSGLRASRLSPCRSPSRSHWSVVPQRILTAWPLDARARSTVDRICTNGIWKAGSSRRHAILALHAPSSCCWLHCIIHLMSASWSILRLEQSSARSFSSDSAR